MTASAADPGVRHIAVVGAGAVGGYVGAGMASHGHDVTLIDPWPEHIATIRRDGMHLSGTEGERRIAVNALDVTDVQTLAKRPVHVAFICMKLYDTAWASALIRPYLAPTGVVVTMQNSLVEQTVASIVGAERTLGAIASLISVEAVAPGHIVRTQEPGGSTYTVFRIGEINGVITPRALAIAEVLRCVDSAKVTANLWGERWSKLVANTMTTGLCAILGASLNDLVATPERRDVQIRLAAEAIRIGLALGYALEPVRGLPAQRWLDAATGERGALDAVETVMAAGAKRKTAASRSGTAQDIAKGRRTEIEFMNGYVASEGARIGIPAPTHAAITALVKRIERGELAPSPRHAEAL